MDLVICWFADNPINFLQILTVGLLIDDNNINNTTNTTNTNTTNSLRDRYIYVTDLIHRNRRISEQKHNDLIEEFDKYDSVGLVDDYIKVIGTVSKKPNLFNPGVWIPDNTFGRIKNRCFPCRNKSNYQ